MHFSAAGPRRRSLPSNGQSADFAKYRRAGSLPESRAEEPLRSASNDHRLQASASVSIGDEIARCFGDFRFFGSFRELLCREFEYCRVNHFRAGKVNAPSGDVPGLAGIAVSFAGEGG